MSIIINNLSYIHPNHEPLFKDISFSIEAGVKTSIIGDNGVGKSTLFRLIADPASLDGKYEGEIHFSSTPYYIPQHYGQYDDLTIARILKADKKIKALSDLEKAVSDKAISEALEIIKDDWDIEQRVISALDEWELGYLDINRELSTLSGGEKSKLFLAGISVHKPRTVLMDEPSNHLDLRGRELLYNYISNERGVTLLIISHDKNLLNLLNQTIELDEKGITIYGGNYDFYKEMYNEKMSALRNQLESKQKDLRRAEQTRRETIERQNKREARGKKAGEKMGLPKIVQNSLKSHSEQSTGKLKAIHHEKIENLNRELSDIRKEVNTGKELKIDLMSSSLHQGKILIKAEGINYSYGHNPLWKKPLDITIESGDSILIKGLNGSGKTTLLKVLTGMLLPTEGAISANDVSSIVIDQEYSFINNDLTVLEQANLYNLRGLEEHEIKIILNRHLFPPDSWGKKNSSLSGGEKIRLLFCSLIISQQSPDIIILDEPTNNLDIRALDTIIRTLRNFKGTIILISHDLHFIRELSCEGEREWRTIDLEQQ